MLGYTVLVCGKLELWSRELQTHLLRPHFVYLNDLGEDEGGKFSFCRNDPIHVLYESTD